MCEIKRTTLYVCPICKKQYKRKGHYLNLHLKKCHAIGWIPKTEIKIVMKQIDEDKLSQAIDLLCSGNFGIRTDPIERIKKSGNKKDQPKCIPAFSEYKEKLKNGGIELVKVPIEELNHIYNIMG